MLVVPLFWCFAISLMLSTMVGCKTSQSSLAIAATLEFESRRLREVPVSNAEVRLYCARVSGWRSVAAVHSWIALREPGEDFFYIIEVMGWQQRDGSHIRIQEREPEKRYRGGPAVLLAQLTGEEAARVIPEIYAAIRSYPHANQYRMYPGPNSNTFVSHVLRNVTDMRIELPPTAIGKDFLAPRVFAFTETGTGAQVALFGILGLSLGVGEGVEVNVLGLSFGFDLLAPALKLPFVGRVGFDDRPLPF